MSFESKIRVIAERIQQLGDTVQTEEATKHAFVLPFLNALGYDVFDPTQVVPEYVADIGTKRGEKIDYMIMIGGAPMIMIECKALDANLNDAHNSQLFRYFAATKTRIAILTNGSRYDFYSDLDAPNVMDARPFLQLDLANLRDRAIAALEKLSREAFDLDAVLDSAASMKRTSAVKQILEEEMDDPSDDFVRMLAGRIYDGRLTKTAIEALADPIRSALKSFVQDQVNKRLRTMLAAPTEQTGPAEQNDENTDTAADDDGIVTTAEEIEGYYAVKSCVRSTIDARRVTMRDGKSYCAILLDNNNRRTICRLWFNGRRKYLGLLDTARKETRHEVSHVDDIFDYATSLQTRVRFLTGDAEAQAGATDA